MAYRIRRVDYYYATVQDEPSNGYLLLSQLAELGINLLAFTGVPIGPVRMQLTLFPEHSQELEDAAAKAGLRLDGPHPALLVQGDDELGALAGVHEKLHQANVEVSASSGVTDGAGSFGYVLYLRPTDFERAAEALGI